MPELAHSPMTDKQRAYRAEYRSRIVRWWEWLTIPVVFVLCNVFEWWVHRYVMHRPRWDRGSRASYTRHTLFSGYHQSRVRTDSSRGARTPRGDRMHGGAAGVKSV